MITLNLIPDDIKKAHIKLHINRLLRNNLMVLLTVASLISIVTLLGRFYLDRTFVYVIEDTTQVTSRIESPLVRGVKESNDILKAVKIIQDEYIPWHKLLLTLGALTPDTVVIKQIQITKDQNTLRILGTSANREGFLELKERLETNPLFTSVDSPISNILNKTDINFTLGVTLDTGLIE